MKKLAILVGILWMLTGCYRVEFDIDFASERMSMVTRESQQLLAMRDGNAREDCEATGGTFSTDLEWAICTNSADFSLSEWIAAGGMTMPEKFASDASQDTAGLLEIQEIEAGTFRVEWDLEKMIADSKESGNEIEEEMKPMVLTLAATGGIEFAFSGAEIIETNGALDDDAKAVRFVLPLTDLLEPANRQTPDRYFAVFRK